MRGTPNSFARRLLHWYDRHRRPLPWRLPGEHSGRKLDPYHVLVSEAMLQQTQVATVIPYFQRFVARFPTVQALAAAQQQEVLRLWQGLGYYTRARNLHHTAQMIVSGHNGQVPKTAEVLQSLPGVGRYTAGAVASIAFGCRSPIVDGNVARVLCRIDRIDADPRERQTLELLWRRAEEIMPRTRCGDFNSAMMELGATVCTPRTPQCLACPVRQLCQAYADGVQDRIPPPRKAAETPLLKRDIICIRRPAAGRSERWIVEQRPARGRWAGMWQFLTIPAGAGPTSVRSIQAALPVRTDEPRLIGSITHALTHRRYAFDVYICTAASRSRALVAPRRWVTLDELDNYPLPRPHVKVRMMVQHA